MEELQQETLPLEGESEALLNEEPLPAEKATEAAVSEGAEEETAEGLEDTGEPTDFEALSANDLFMIKQAFPALRKIQSLTELENLERYGQLREAGLTAVEAAAATQYTRLREKGREDTRRHLSSSVPPRTAPSQDRITLSELRAARELFPKLPDREIEALYRRASRQSH